MWKLLEKWLPRPIPMKDRYGDVFDAVAIRTDVETGHYVILYYKGDWLNNLCALRTGFKKETIPMNDSRIVILPATKGGGAQVLSFRRKLQGEKAMPEGAAGIALECKKDPPAWQNLDDSKGWFG